jgi:hypothetical protein
MISKSYLFLFLNFTIILSFASASQGDDLFARKNYYFGFSQNEWEILHQENTALAYKIKGTNYFQETLTIGLDLYPFDDSRTNPPYGKKACLVDISCNGRGPILAEWCKVQGTKNETSHNDQENNLGQALDIYKERAQIHQSRRTIIARTTGIAVFAIVSSILLRFSYSSYRYGTFNNVQEPQHNLFVDVLRVTALLMLATLCGFRSSHASKKTYETYAKKLLKEEFNKVVIRFNAIPITTTLTCNQTRFLFPTVYKERIQNGYRLILHPKLIEASLNSLPCSLLKTPQGPAQLIRRVTDTSRVEFHNPLRPSVTTFYPDLVVPFVTTCHPDSLIFNQAKEANHET